MHLFRTLLLLLWSILRNHHSMVPLIRLQSKLFQRLEILTLQLGNLPPKHRLRCRRRINTRSLNRNHRMSPILQKVMRIQSHNSCLIGLGNIGKYTIDHTDEHAVFEGMTRVFDDGNDVGSGFGNVEEVASRSVGEFNGVDGSLGADNVGDVGDGGTGGGSEVEDLGAGFDPDVVDTTEDGGGNCFVVVCGGVEIGR